MKKKWCQCKTHYWCAKCKRWIAEGWACVHDPERANDAK